MSALTQRTHVQKLLDPEPEERWSARDIVTQWEPFQPCASATPDEMGAQLAEHRARVQAAAAQRQHTLAADHYAAAAQAAAEQELRALQDNVAAICEQRPMEPADLAHLQAAGGLRPALATPPPPPHASPATDAAADALAASVGAMQLRGDSALEAAAGLRTPPASPLRAPVGASPATPACGLNADWFGATTPLGTQASAAALKSPCALLHLCTCSLEPARRPALPLASAACADTDAAIALCRRVKAGRAAVT